MNYPTVLANISSALTSITTKRTQLNLRTVYREMSGYCPKFLEWHTFSYELIQNKINRFEKNMAICWCGGKYDTSNAWLQHICTPSKSYGCSGA